MIITNNGQGAVVINLITGEPIYLPPLRDTQIPDAKLKYLDDSAVTIAMFNTGILTAKTDLGAAFPGFPTVAFPRRRMPVVDASLGDSIVGSRRVSRLSGSVWCPSAGSFATNGPATRTWTTILAHPNKPFAFRVGYLNPLTTQVTFDKTSITPSSSFVPSGVPTGGAPQTNVLFGGSAPAVQDAAGSVELLTFKMSDWTFAAPIDRVDSPVGMPLSYLKTYISAAGYAYISNAKLANYGQNYADGMIRQVSFANGDFIASPAGFVGTGSNAVALAMMVETRDIGGSVRIAGIGDSTFNNSTIESGGQFNSWGEQMCRILNSEGNRFFSYANFGWSSQGIRGGSAGSFAARVPAMLAAADYDVVFVQTHSPNNAPSDRASLDADINAVLNIIEQVRADGAVPIPVAGNPAVALNATQDGLRLLSNEFFRSACEAMRIPFVDINSKVSDGNSPARLLTSMSADGTHLTTDLGGATQATASADAVLKIYN